MIIVILEAGDGRGEKPYTSRSGSRELGWRDGESARLPPMCRGFDSRTRRHMLVEFFSEFSGFPPFSKINISKFQFDREFEGHGFASQFIYLFVYLFIYLF